MIDTPHNLGGLRVDHPKAGVLRVLDVAIGRRRQRHAGIAFHLVHDPALPLFMKWSTFIICKPAYRTPAGAGPTTTRNFAMPPRQGICISAKRGYELRGIYKQEHQKSGKRGGVCAQVRPGRPLPAADCGGLRRRSVHRHGCDLRKRPFSAAGAEQRRDCRGAVFLSGDGRTVRVSLQRRRLGQW